MNLTDSELVETLRERVSSAPPMTLDPADVVHLGRRRVRARRAGAAAGALVLVAAVAVGVSALPGGVAAPPAATTAPEPSATPSSAALPDADVVTLAPTLRAVRSPVATTAPDGTTWWLTGLSADGQELMIGAEPQWWGTQMRVPFAVGDPRTDDERLSLDVPWDPEADVRDHGSGNGYPSQASTALGVPGDMVQLGLGAVPAWMPGTRVALTFSYGVPDAEGRVRHVFELPTFADPSGTGASLYAFAGDPSLADLTGAVPRGETVSGGYWVVYVAPDGSTYVNGLEVTPQQLGLWLSQAPVDEVVAELRALGAVL